ncbi:hypothetical protein QD357_07690 [Rhizobium sp. BR 317]|uniref:hypothetical protein n=1 Tax=Rhizobium sp. BR 317 TaxID=3040015 RepID=UPI0039BF10C7
MHQNKVHGLTGGSARSFSGGERKQQKKNGCQEPQGPLATPSDTLREQAEDHEIEAWKQLL